MPRSKIKNSAGVVAERFETLSELSERGLLFVHVTIFLVQQVRGAGQGTGPFVGRHGPLHGPRARGAACCDAGRLKRARRGCGEAGQPAEPRGCGASIRGSRLRGVCEVLTHFRGRPQRQFGRVSFLCQLPLCTCIDRPRVAPSSLQVLHGSPAGSLCELLFCVGGGGGDPHLGAGARALVRRDEPSLAPSQPSRPSGRRPVHGEPAAAQCCAHAAGADTSR